MACLYCNSIRHISMLQRLVFNTSQCCCVLSVCCCSPEYIAMQVLPPCLIMFLSHLIITCVLQEVILQHSQQNGCQEPSQQQYCDAAVDDGEPVNLQGTNPDTRHSWDIQLQNLVAFTILLIEAHLLCVWFVACSITSAHSVCYSLVCFT